MFRSKNYSLSKSRRILRSAYALYRRKHRKLTPSQCDAIESLLERLDQAILAKDRMHASQLARELEGALPDCLRKGIVVTMWEGGLSLAFALIVATIVRQMWFEPMEIPSGSMRPTFQELDRLLVSKTSFGLNIPLTTGHFYFNPERVERTGVFIFTSEGMDIPDQDTRYFLLFPGKRRLIKRCMGKPGDALYFYGGKIYGSDENGRDLLELRESPWMEGIDAVPFITFDGKTSSSASNPQGVLSPVYLNQMNQKVARLSVLSNGGIRGEIFNGERWVPDDPTLSDQTTLHTYSQLYGICNYAMVRLLTREELIRYSEAPLEGVPSAELYLEIRHHPSLSHPKPKLGRDMTGHVRPVLVPEVSVIPLESEHQQALRNNLYTARFLIDHERARPDRPESPVLVGSPQAPLFPGVPDGRYQFTHGIAYSVDFGGILNELPPDHPLYRTEYLQKLFNLGMEMNTLFAPYSKEQPFYPARYAYYRDGALFVMGGEIFKADDPTLVAFNQREQVREATAPRNRPYQAFQDHGPPLKEDGSLDVGFIRTFGLHVPEKGYLALGDNYANSSDSRQFGFVPEANIQGAPATIIWPLGPRWGTPEQKPYPILTGPRLFVWGVALCTLGTFVTVRTVRNRRPLVKKKNDK